MQIFTGKVQQNSDGSFAAVNYGRNLFLGNSIKERECAVARAFDTCIVVEGTTACIVTSEPKVKDRVHCRRVIYFKLLITLHFFLEAVM